MFSIISVSAVPSLFSLVRMMRSALRCYIPLAAQLVKVRHSMSP